MVRAHSIDALIAAAGIDAGAGFQAIGTGSAEHAAASVSAVTPVLVLAREGAGDLARALVGVLSKYAGETPVTLLVDRAGAVVGEDGGTVAAAAPALLEGSWPAGWEEVVAVALPALAAEEVRDDLRGLVGVIRRLRDPEDGCPWDLAQDHQSLRPHLLEETYEVLEALDGLSGDGSSMGEPVSALREELGDLLMQVVLQARVAEQAGEFTLVGGGGGDPVEAGAAPPACVRGGGGGDAGGGRAELGSDQGGGVEGGRGAAGVGDRGGAGGAAGAGAGPEADGAASRRGFAWESDGDVLAKLAEELGEIAAAGESERAGEVGDLLFVVCDFLRRQGVEAEDALREACGKFERRFRALEGLLREEGVAMESVGQVGLLERWERVKGEVG